MLTGEEYRQSLRDGRRVWAMGEGPIDDLASHPATSAMVDFYADWYDRHFDPAWQDVLLTETDVQGKGRPLAFTLAQTIEDIRRLGRSIYAISFRSAGNVTHTPGYGHLIAIGIVDALKSGNLPSDRIAAAEANLESLERDGRSTLAAATQDSASSRRRARAPGGLLPRRDPPRAGGLARPGYLCLHCSGVFSTAPGRSPWSLPAVHESAQSWLEPRK